MIKVSGLWSRYGQSTKCFSQWMWPWDPSAGSLLVNTVYLAPNSDHVVDVQMFKFIVLFMIIVAKV